MREYNTARPHQSCGGRPPTGRFRLAGRSVIPDDCAASAPAQAAPRAGQAAGRPAGVPRCVNAHGKISLAGFSYNVGATYADEPVEVVAAGGLADILHAGVVVATCAQRFREDQAGRAPRAPVARRARDATAGVTVTRLADAAGAVSFAGTPHAAGRRWARTAIDVCIVAGPMQLSKDGKVVRVRHGHARELGAFADPGGDRGARTPPSATPPDRKGIRRRRRGRPPSIRGRTSLVKGLRRSMGGPAIIW